MDPSWLARRPSVRFLPQRVSLELAQDGLVAKLQRRYSAASRGRASRCSSGVSGVSSHGSSNDDDCKPQSMPQRGRPLVPQIDGLLKARALSQDAEPVWVTTRGAAGSTPREDLCVFTSDRKRTLIMAMDSPRAEESVAASLESERIEGLEQEILDLQTKFSIEKARCIELERKLREAGGSSSQANEEVYEPKTPLKKTGQELAAAHTEASKGAPLPGSGGQGTSAAPSGRLQFFDIGSARQPAEAMGEVLILGSPVPDPSWLCRGEQPTLPTHRQAGELTRFFSSTSFKVRGPEFGTDAKVGLSKADWFAHFRSSVDCAVAANMKHVVVQHTGHGLNPDHDGASDGRLLAHPGSFVLCDGVLSMCEILGAWQEALTSLRSAQAGLMILWLLVDGCFSHLCAGQLARVLDLTSDDYESEGVSFPVSLELPLLHLPLDERHRKLGGGVAVLSTSGSWPLSGHNLTKLLNADNGTSFIRGCAALRQGPDNETFGVIDAALGPKEFRNLFGQGQPLPCSLAALRKLSGMDATRDNSAIPRLIGAEIAQLVAGMSQGSLEQCAKAASGLHHSLCSGSPHLGAAAVKAGAVGRLVVLLQEGNASSSKVGRSAAAAVATTLASLASEGESVVDAPGCLEALTALLCRGETDGRAAACRALRRFAEGAPQDRRAHVFGVAGVVEGLVATLRRGTSRGQADAAAALQALAFGCERRAAGIALTPGCLESLGKLLKTGSPPVRIPAAGALQNLSALSSTATAATPAVLEGLVAQLLAGTPAEASAAAAAALGNLAARSEACRASVAATPRTLEALVGIAQSGSPEGQANAAGALCRIAAGAASCRRRRSLQTTKVAKWPSAEVTAAKAPEAVPEAPVFTLFDLVAKSWGE